MQLKWKTHANVHTFRDFVHKWCPPVGAFQSTKPHYRWCHLTRIRSSRRSESWPPFCRLPAGGLKHALDVIIVASSNHSFDQKRFGELTTAEISIHWKHHNVVSTTTYWSILVRFISILTWHRGNRDHLGGSSRLRPFHCTSVWLTFAITPNVGDSGA